MNVIIDTNVLVSAIIRDRIPEKIILWVVTNPYVYWIASDNIILEYTNVIRRPKFSLSPEQLGRWESLFSDSILVFNPENKIDFKPDPLDAKFIECAIGCNADYIIAGDNHFHNVNEVYDVKILTVAEFYHKFIENK